MADNESDEPTTGDLGRTIGRDDSELSGIVGHAYRGELDRETTWRTRLDQSTTWSVTIVAAVLTWAFSSPDNPHYVILVGVGAVGTFLLIEARRYRDYDVYRARVRLYQENLLGPAFDPDRACERVDWRTELSDDYRQPTFKVSLFEAASNRLRRIYFALLSVLGLAWLVRITAFPADGGPLNAAAIGSLPGSVVLLCVGAFYASLVVVVFWPHEREAKGEVRESDVGAWKDEK